MGLASALADAGMKNAAQQSVSQFISTGYPPLDNALSGSYVNGGFPSGRIIEMFGPPSAGKTAISTFAMASAQKAGGFAMFQDHENSFDADLGVLACGLVTDPDFWCYNKPDSFEQSIEQVTDTLLIARGLAFKNGQIIPSGAPVLFDLEKPIVIVFDSLASMVPQSVMTDSKGKTRDASTRNMNDNTALSRATSAHFPFIALLAERCNATFIFLNQVRTKLGVMYGDPTTTPGGGAPEFYASIRVKLGRSMIMSADKKTKIGQCIGAEIIKNKISAPFRKATWDFMWLEDGSGRFDVIGGVIEELITIGKITRSGAWVEWDGKKWNSMRLLSAHIEEKGQYPTLLAMFPQ